MFKAAHLLALFGSALFCSTAAFADGVVNVYSYRQPQLVQPLFDAFKKETGIEVKMVFAEKGPAAASATRPATAAAPASTSSSR